jgi:hypothetical protein
MITEQKVLRPLLILNDLENRCAVNMPRRSSRGPAAKGLTKATTPGHLIE